MTLWVKYLFIGGAPFLRYAQVPPHSIPSSETQSITTHSYAFLYGKQLVLVQHHWTKKITVFFVLIAFRYEHMYVHIVRKITKYMFFKCIHA